jgi:hypothetical protein
MSTNNHPAHGKQQRISRRQKNTCKPVMFCIWLTLGEVGFSSNNLTVIHDGVVVSLWRSYQLAKLKPVLM